MYVPWIPGNLLQEVSADEQLLPHGSNPLPLVLPFAERLYPRYDFDAICSLTIDPTPLSHAPRSAVLFSGNLSSQNMLRKGH